MAQPSIQKGRHACKGRLRCRRRGLSWRDRDKYARLVGHRAQFNISVMDFADLLDRTREYLPEKKLALIEEAYEFAAECHAGQTRKSGDPFIVHPLDTAMT